MYQVNQKTAGFHSKGYIFEYDDCYKILIGSANITQSALKSNIEWNLQIISKKDNKVVENILKELRQQGKNKTIAIGSTCIGEPTTHCYY